MDIHHAAPSTYHMTGNKCAVLLGIQNISTMYLIMNKGADIDSIWTELESAVQQHFAQNPEPVPTKMPKPVKPQTPETLKEWSLRVCMYMQAKKQYLDIVTIDAPSNDPADIKMVYPTEYGADMNALLEDLCTDMWIHAWGRTVKAWYRHPRGTGGHFQGALFKCILKPISFSRCTNLVNRVFFNIG